MWTNARPVKVAEQHLDSVSLSVGDGELRDTIGPGAFLARCSVAFRGSAVLVTLSTFHECEIKSLAKARGLRMDQSRFEKCQFSGKFRGWVFGNYGVLSDDWPDAGVQECDLSDAWLHLATFHRCDARKQTWPLWPQIAVFDMRENISDWMRTDLPEAIRHWQEDLAATAQDYDVKTVDVFDLSTRLGDSDLAEVRTVLATKPYIIGP